MRTSAQIRRDNLDALLIEAGSKAEIGRRLGRSDKQVGQWFGKGSSRNISDKLCRELEEAFGKPIGWMDTDHQGESQSWRPPNEKFRASVELLLYTLESLGKPVSMVSDMAMLEMSYEVVEADGRDLTPAVMLDLNRILSSKIRENHDGVDRGAAPRTRGKAG